jgi:putative ABC transport system ATP-binding protein
VTGPPPGPGGDHPAARLVVEDVAVELGGRRVLEHVDLTLDAGRPVGLTGPSGSGKTVLCLVLAGALRPTSGSVRLDRAAGAPAAPAGYLAGLVLQSHGLVSGLTAEENVALPLQARRVERADVAARTAAALGDVGLEKHAARLVDELSGGERQRVGIARAMALDPTVLVADEPTSELDPGNRERVLSLFTALSGRGRVVVIASDDPEVSGGCGSVVALERGSVAGVAARR